MNVLSFAIQTIPDTDAGRVLFNLGDLDDNGAAKAMFHLQHQQTGSDHLPHYLQKIIAISIIHREGDYQLDQLTIGGSALNEESLLTDFYRRVDKHYPILVSWPGFDNDVPIMSYRSMKNSVRANCFLNNAGNYNYIDLKNLFSAYHADASAPLGHMSSLLGFSPCEPLGKREIWKMWLDNHYDQIAQHTAQRALNTHRIYLRLLLVQGKLTQGQYEHEIKRVAD